MGNHSSFLLCLSSPPRQTNTMYDGYRPKTQAMNFGGKNRITTISESGGRGNAGAADVDSEAAEEAAAAAAAKPGGASLFQTLRPYAPQDTKRTFLPLMSTKRDIIKQTLPTNFGTSTRKLMSTSHDAFRLRTLPRGFEPTGSLRYTTLGFLPT